MDFLKFYEEIDFDIGRRTLSKFKAKQGDAMSRGFFVRVVQKGQLASIDQATMKGRFLLPNNEKVERSAIKADGRFRLDIPSEVLLDAGEVYGELELYGSAGELITNDRFTIQVGSSIRMEQVNVGGGDTGGGSGSSDDFKLLESRIAAVEMSKVEKETGKGLSTNNYTNADKAEVAKIKNKTDKTYVDGLVGNINALLDELNGEVV